MNYREVPVTTVPQKVWISSCLRVPTDKDAKPFYGRLEEAKFPDRLMWITSASMRRIRALGSRRR